MDIDNFIQTAEPYKSMFNTPETRSDQSEFLARKPHDNKEKKMPPNTENTGKEKKPFYLLAEHPRKSLLGFLPKNEIPYNLTEVKETMFPDYVIVHDGFGPATGRAVPNAFAMFIGADVYGDCVLAKKGKDGLKPLSLDEVNSLMRKLGYSKDNWYDKAAFEKFNNQKETEIRFETWVEDNIKDFKLMRSKDGRSELYAKQVPEGVNLICGRTVFGEPGDYVVCSVGSNGKPETWDAAIMGQKWLESDYEVKKVQDSKKRTSRNPKDGRIL